MVKYIREYCDEIVLPYLSDVKEWLGEITKMLIG